MYTCNPNGTPCFWLEFGPCFGGWKNHQNRGKTGSRYIYIYLLVLPAKMFKHVISLNTQNLTSWWSNQPHLKNMLVKLDHFPKVSGWKIKNNALKFHHLVMYHLPKNQKKQNLSRVIHLPYQFFQGLPSPVGWSWRIIVCWWFQDPPRFLPSPKTSPVVRSIEIQPARLRSQPEAMYGIQLGDGTLPVQPSKEPFKTGYTP